MVLKSGYISTFSIEFDILFNYIEWCNNAFKNNIVLIDRLMLKYTKIILLLTNVINTEERITHSRQFPKTINSNSVATITQLENFKQVYINKRILWHLSRSFTTITLWKAKGDIASFVPIEHLGTIVLDQNGLFLTT